MHGQSVAVLRRAPQSVDVADVELGIDALREQVHRQVHDVDVAGAFAVAEQRALDAIRAGHHAELGRSDRAAAVVVRMQAARSPLSRCVIVRPNHSITSPYTLGV